jgi:hypothetical protein
MPPLTPRQKQASSMKRRTDGSFWRLKLNHEKDAPPETKDVDQVPCHRRGGLFGPPDRHDGRMRAPEYEVEKIWAKRWVGNDVFFLVQWVGFRELTWEPQKNLAWQTIAEFERETIDSVWVFQSMGGRRQSQPIERPSRKSPRLNGC